MKIKPTLVAVPAILSLALILIAQQAPTTPPATAANPPAPSVNVQALIKATDEEWKVINPRLQAVVSARQSVMTYTASGGGRGGFGPNFGPGFGPNFGPNFGTDSFEGPGNGLGAGRGGRGGAPGGPDGRGGPNGFGGPPPPGDPNGPGRQGAGRGGPGGNNNPVGAALADLTKALADSTSTPEQIKAKVAAVRIARQKAVADFAAAQKVLLPLLTADQEATLVSLGYLD